MREYYIISLFALELFTKIANSNLNNLKRLL